MNDGGTYHDPPKEIEVVELQEWYTLRRARITEEEVEGGKLKYKLQIWDEGREPFVTQRFNDITPALDLLERIKNENERHHNIRR